MNPVDRERLRQAVQSNCHIADARHATDMPLCIYLLQMREFYRWECRRPFGAWLAQADVGTWIATREALWNRFEAQEYGTLPLADDSVDAFDVAQINRRLRPCGLLYGAGLVEAGRPVFFLAEWHGGDRREGLEVHFAGRELARGLHAPVAMLDGQDEPAHIVVRRESLARWCWEKFEAFSLRRPAGSPFHAVVQAYGLDHDFDGALPRWIDDQGEAAVLHELGEHRAGQRLGPEWGTMRMSLPTRRGALHARAVRDHLADLEVTLPTLLERDARASIHVWFANLDGVREALFPALGPAYAAWCKGDGGCALRATMARGRAHFGRIAAAALALHAKDGAAAATAIEKMLTAPDSVCRPGG